MKVLFNIIDNIGIGHLLRSINLAEKLQQKFKCECHFFIPSTFQNFVTEKKLDHTILPDFRQANSDIESFNAEYKSNLNTIKPNTIIYDNYFNDELLEYSKEIAAKNILMYNSSLNKKLVQLINNDQISDFSKIIVPYTFDSFYETTSDKEIITFFSKNKKVIFTGSIVNKEKENSVDEIIQQYGIEKDDFVMLVSIGGGNQPESLTLLQNIFKNYNQLKSKIKNLKTIIITGPLFNKYIVPKDKTIIVNKYEENIQSLMRMSDMIIGHANYNIINESVLNKIPGFFIPLNHQKDMSHYIETYCLGKFFKNDLISEILEFQLDLSSYQKNLNKFNFPYGNNFAVNEIVFESASNKMEILRLKRKNKNTLNSINISITDKNNTNQLSYNSVKNMINEASMLNAKEIIFSGGEPLTHPQIFDFINYTSKKGIKSTVATNGNLLSEYFIKKLEQTGLSKLIISLESYNPLIHDNINNSDGLHQKTIEAFSTIKKFNIEIAVKTTLNSKNIESIEKILDISIINQIKSHSFSISNSPINKEVLKTFYSKSVPKMLDVSVNNNINISIEPFFSNIQYLLKNISKSNSILEKIKDQLENNIEKFDEELSLYSEGRYNHSCTENSIFINPTGFVFPCSKHQSSEAVSTFNAIKKSLYGIIKSKEFSKLATKA